VVGLNRDSIRISKVLVLEKFLNLNPTNNPELTRCSRLQFQQVIYVTFEFLSLSLLQVTKIDKSCMFIYCRWYFCTDLV